MNLSGKKILVTGGSRGIGAAMVRDFARRGAKVAFTYASKVDAAEEVLKSLPGEGHFHFNMNLEKEESIVQGLDQVFSQWGELHGVVANAGLTRDQLLLRMKVEDFDQVISANLRGNFILTKALLKPWLKARAGSLVFMTSVIGQTGNAGQANYAASKAGLIGFAKSVAQEVASRGIRVNCIAPGFIATDMTHSLTPEQKATIANKIPLERIAQPQEVASAAAYLLSDESSYVTGHTLSVNGGLYMN